MDLTGDLPQVRTAEASASRLRVCQSQQDVSCSCGRKIGPQGNMCEICTSSTEATEKPVAFYSPRHIIVSLGALGT